MISDQLFFDDLLNLYYCLVKTTDIQKLNIFRTRK